MNPFGVIWGGLRWMVDNWSTVWSTTVEHTILAVIPTVLGLVIAIPVGMVLHGRPNARRIAVVIASVVFTIPSLALFVVIPTVLGTKILDPLNVVVALTLYSVALLIRTVLESLDSVPTDVRAAASAVGYSRLRRSLLVDLPLSIPVLTAGTRVVAVTNVSLVSVGAVIGVGGLGQLFTAGYQRAYPEQVFAGIFAILVLALIFDRLIALLGTALTPWLRGRTRRQQAATDLQVAAELSDDRAGNEVSDVR